MTGMTSTAVSMFLMLFATGNRADAPPFKVRPGYKVAIATQSLGDARFLEVDDKGTLYVSQPRGGKIMALRDKDGDGVFETSATFVEGKSTVHGMHFVDGWLWFTQTGSIHKARDTDGDGRADEIVTVIKEGALPSQGGHWWRSICVTKDALYTSIGDTGNITDLTASDREKIWKYDLTGGNKKLFCSGIRNTEKLRFRPGTDDLYGCDHGSDWYGQPFGDTNGHQPVTDLNPPDEFNHYVEGGFYGHPFIVGNKLPRLEFSKRKDINDLADKTIPPAWCNGAHWANNGFCFLSKDYFSEHKGDALIAFHGSWNSERKVGYCIQRILFDKWTGKPYGSQTIVSTLSEDGNEVLGRPVDLVETPDGSVLFSCDWTRRVYRISKE